MFDEIDRGVETWIKDVLGDVAVTFGPPAPGEGGPSANAYLMEIRSRPPERGQELPPFQVQLRYLITTWDADASTAHRLLGELVFAAMEQRDPELDLDPPPPAVWAALGVTPRPSFHLGVTAKRERPVRRGPPVRHVDLDPRPLAAFEGLVLGPEGTPIPHARVEIPTMGLSTSSDADGRFRFGALPAAMPFVVRVHAKGRSQEGRAEAPAVPGQGGPLVIRLPIQED